MALADKYFTYVVTKGKAERREIVIGDANDEFMEIIDGVAEGESVVMNPRTHFSREINDLEIRLKDEMEENRPRVETPKRPTGGPGAGGPPSGNKPGGPGAGGGKPQNGPPAGGGAGGQGGGNFDPKAIMNRLDTNKDGVITKDESDLRGNFDSIDADGDGKVTAEEFSKPRS